MAESADNKIDAAALGLTLLPEFISANEEAELLAQINKVAPSRQKKVPMRNSIRRYGSSEPYFDNVVSPTIPDHFLSLCQRLVEQKLVAAMPDSVTVNEYYAGQVIKAHVDRINAGPVITILSLGSPAVMEFARGDQQFSVKLFPRGLVQLRNEIRYDWTHAIAPVPGLRYSLVFRDSASCITNTRAFK
jgi:alkylated DNA repair dioxygenase AlkB